MPKWTQIRFWLFLLSIAAAAVSVGDMVGLYLTSRHWDGLYGHVNELQDWVGGGFLAALASFLLVWFGRGWKPIAMLVIAFTCMAIWYRESAAV